MSEKKTVQPYNWFFGVIFTLAMLVSRLLHPVSVQGLEHLPRHGALLCGKPLQQLGSHPSGHGAAPGLPAAGHGKGGAVPQPHFELDSAHRRRLSG